MCNLVHATFRICERVCLVIVHIHKTIVLVERREFHQPQQNLGEAGYEIELT